MAFKKNQVINGNLIVTGGLNAVGGLNNNSHIIVNKTRRTVHARTEFNSTHDLLQGFEFNSPDLGLNPNVEMLDAYLIDSNSDDNDVSGDIYLKKENDDIAPNNLNGTFIGGGHGCSDARQLTCTSHGKTNIDIGSEWTDGASTKYYIIRIIDENTIAVLSENSSATDVWDFDTSISGSTLTHSSGATHTGDITIASDDGLYQVHPAINPVSWKCELDGKELTENGTYYGDMLDIVDEYNILDVPSILDVLIANVGTDYADDEAIYNVMITADPMLKMRITYRILSNGCMLVMTNWQNLQAIDLSYFGFTQVSPFGTIGSNDTLELYIPKTVLYDGKNFAEIEDYSSALASAILIDPTNYWADAGNAPDRFIQFLGDGVDRAYGLAVGYDKSVGIGTLRNSLDTAIQLYTSRKLYPHGLEDANTDVGVGGGIEFHSCVNYRQFMDMTNTNNGSATCVYYYKLGKHYVLYVDYHTQVENDKITLSSELEGLEVDVIEKSTNMTVEEDIIVGNQIAFTVNDSNYAYAVLKLS